MRWATTERGLASIDGGDRLRTHPTYQDMLSRSTLMYVSTPQDVKAMQEALESDGKPLVVGMDAEWRPRSKCKVAVLQLSTASTNFVIHLSQLKEVPPSVSSLLTDPSVLKVGVGVVGDARRLAAQFGVVTRGCVELVPLLLSRSDMNVKLKSASLKSLVTGVVGVTLLKNQRIVCGDWERFPLNTAQLLYAAADAHFGRRAFEVIAHSKPHLKWTRDSLLGWCKGLIDVKAKGKLPKARKAAAATQQHDKGPTLGTANHDTDSDNASYFRGPSTKRLYENCRMLAPDGVLIATCDSKKLSWYLERNLATRVDHRTIKLNFEPSGRGNAGDEFYLADHKNICVVCGHEDETQLRRRNVVPRCYRQYFPEEYKTHSHHDVVLMCFPCHGKADMLGARFRRELSEKWNVPLDPAELKGKRVLTPEEKRKAKIRGCATGLLRYGSTIPATRKAAMLQNIAEFVQKAPEEVTEQDLKRLSKLSHPHKPTKRESHGAKMVAKILQHGDIGVPAFCRLWRERFVEEMQPKHLHPKWDVNHMRKRDRPGKAGRHEVQLNQRIQQRKQRSEHKDDAKE